MLQETIERNQTELAAQKEFYTNALNAAKEAEALAESRVNTEAKVELESRLREACEKENMLINTIEELRNALTRQEQEAAFMEERLKRDHDDLQKRYQASELRYNELVTQVPESTRPLLRQIEAMQVFVLPQIFPFLATLSCEMTGQAILSPSRCCCASPLDVPSAIGGGAARGGAGTEVEEHGFSADLLLDELGHSCDGAGAVCVMALLREIHGRRLGDRKQVV